MTPDPKSATDAARVRLAQALQRQKDLANASVTNPALEADYHRAVADVAAAQDELQEMTK